jgi:hypothetical protein
MAADIHVNQSSGRGIGLHGQESLAAKGCKARRLLDWYTGFQGAAKRGRLVHLEGVRAGADVHLGDPDERALRAEQRLSLSGIAGNRGALDLVVPSKICMTLVSRA